MDLFNIPNDTGGDWRLNKFIEYQHKAISVAPPMLREYALRHDLSKPDKIYLCWLHSLTYCELTALLLFEDLHYKAITPDSLRDFWENHKQKLQFCSSRVYVKNMDWFIPLMVTFMKNTKGNPYKWLKGIYNDSDSPEDKYNAIYKYLSKWKYMGRFSIERFMEILVSMCEHELLPLDIKTYSVDWSHGSNLTSGILNIYYKDEEANKFDKTGKLPDKGKQFVLNKSQQIYEAVMEKYPEQENQDFIIVMSKICSFRNLFKEARYGGYHHDRQLEILYHYQEKYPDKQDLWDEIFEIRSKAYQRKLLGELNGWKGVRKDRKRLFLREGLTGVE